MDEFKNKKQPTKLSSEVIDYLRSGGEVVHFAENDKIISFGDPDLAFYVILSGEVEVRLTGDDGNFLPLSRLGKNSSFGEMSLIRKKPVSADIIALSSVSVLKYPKNKFFKALSESEEFRMELMSRMAQNMQDTSNETWSFFQRSKALNMLAQKEINQYEEPLISRSVRMKNFEKEINEIEDNSGPILISGESGTGKTFISRKIHNLLFSQTLPFIIIDCSELGDYEVNNVLFGSSELQNDRNKLTGFGAIHLAHTGTLVLKHIDKLNLLSQKYLLQFLDSIELNKKNFFPKVQIIATTKEKLENLDESDRFLSDLLLYLNKNTLMIPTLKERKADILPLTQIFLNNIKSDNSKTMSENAEHTLLSLNYMHNNVKELRETVESSSIFSEEGKILSEHIFSGPKDKGSLYEFNLSEIPFVKKIINRKTLFVFRSGILFFFIGIIISCLFFSKTKTGIFANSLIWMLWEPVLIFIFLFFGRIWCTVCPISTISIWIQNLFSLKKPTSIWIKKYSVLLFISGLFMIFLSEKVFHMTINPIPSGFLLLILMISAIFFSTVYQREVWCRYICPLGALAAGFSLPASLHLRAEPHICSTYCSTHECFKGTEKKQGCSVFHHPLYISESYNCKLCFKCLDICPHKSIQIYFRPFLKGVWFFGGFAKHLSVFSLSIFSLSIFMLATKSFFKINDPLNMIIIATLSLFAGFFLYKLIFWIMTFRKPYTDRALTSKVSFALMILAWGPLMAYQFSNITFFSSVWIYTGNNSLLAEILPVKDVPLLVLVQAGVILFAAVLSFFTLWRIKHNSKKEDGKLKKGGWYFLITIIIIYTLASFMMIF